MSIFRITHNKSESGMSAYNIDTLQENEWEDTGRLREEAWNMRYEYEKSIVIEVVSKNPTQTILEIGSGPGVLSQLIQKNLPTITDYHLIDKPFAKKYFDENNYIGKFFVKDFSIDLNTDELNKSYDLVICNDTLEHLIAPSNVVKKINSLMHENSMLLVSVPNWRMAHQFLYRGLWDYDNFIYFMHIHGFIMESVYQSPLRTPYYPRISSETTMPDELLQSWNWYFVMKKNKL